MKTRIVKRNESGKKLNGLLVLAVAVSFVVSPVPVWAGNDNLSTNRGGTVIATKPIPAQRPVQQNTKAPAPVLRGLAPVAVRSHIPPGSPPPVPAPDFLTWKGTADTHRQFVERMFPTARTTPQQSGCLVPKARQCIMTYSNAYDAVRVTYVWPAGTSNNQRMLANKITRIAYRNNPGYNTFSYRQGQLVSCGTGSANLLCSRVNAPDMTPAFHAPPPSGATKVGIHNAEFFKIAQPPFQNDSKSHQAYLGTFYKSVTSKDSAGQTITRYTDRITGALVATARMRIADAEQRIRYLEIMYTALVMNNSQVFEYANTVAYAWNSQEKPTGPPIYKLIRYTGPKIQLGCAYNVQTPCHEV